MERERASCSTLIVFLMCYDCKCSVALPHGAVGRLHCVCGISWSYSLTFPKKLAIAFHLGSQYLLMFRRRLNKIKIAGLHISLHKRKSSINKGCAVYYYSKPSFRIS